MTRRRTIVRLALPVAAALLLTACGTSSRWDYTPQDEHIVRSGDTLFSIAWRYGKDAGDLARWNNLGDGSLIHPGQVIRLSAPSGAVTTTTNNSPRAKTEPAGKNLPKIPSQPAPAWRWPSSGEVAVGFGQRPGSGTGILIDGRLGEPVRSAADGRVAYAGSGLIGYGQLIIIKHNDTYLSAYGYNQSLLVKEGQTVKKGQRIATMGEGPGREPRLHFEIRRNGEPINPRQYLPAR